MVVGVVVVVFMENTDAMNILVHFLPGHESKSFSRVYIITTNWKSKNTEQSF